MSDNKILVGFKATPKERESLHALARARGFPITSDYLRKLILEDAERHNFPINFEVDRGGDRVNRDE